MNLRLYMSKRRFGAPGNVPIGPQIEQARALPSPPSASLARRTSGALESAHDRRRALAEKPEEDRDDPGAVVMVAGATCRVDRLCGGVPRDSNGPGLAPAGSSRR